MKDKDELQREWLEAMPGATPVLETKEERKLQTAETNKVEQP